VVEWGHWRLQEAAYDMVLHTSLYMTLLLLLGLTTGNVLTRNLGEYQSHNIH